MRSLLFVPADDARRRVRAWTAGADAVILDLEDGVAAGEKAAARGALTLALAQRVPGPLATVRVNEPDSDDGRADLAALAQLDIDAVVVPKARPETVALAAPLGVPVIALIESAAGVLAADAIAAAAPVTRLMFGPLDLAAELGADPGPDGLELLHARSRLVLASAAAGLDGPIDGPFADTTDEPGLRAETQRARRLGFTAKACIHPAQVATVAEVLSPTEADVAWAREVADAYDAAVAGGTGVVALHGRMIDMPIARRAWAILDRAGAAR